MDKIYEAEFTATVHYYYKGQASTILDAIQEAYNQLPEFLEGDVDYIEVTRNGVPIADFTGKEDIEKLIAGKMVKPFMTYEEKPDPQLAVEEEEDAD